MSEDETTEQDQPRKKKRAGYTKNKGLGTPKRKRKIAQASRRRNRK